MLLFNLVDRLFMQLCTQDIGEILSHQATRGNRSLTSDYQQAWVEGAEFEHPQIESPWHEAITLVGVPPSLPALMVSIVFSFKAAMVSFSKDNFFVKICFFIFISSLMVFYKAIFFKDLQHG